MLTFKRKSEEESLTERSGVGEILNIHTNNLHEQEMLQNSLDIFYSRKHTYIFRCFSLFVTLSQTKIHRNTETNI